MSSRPLYRFRDSESHLEHLSDDSLPFDNEFPKSVHEKRSSNGRRYTTLALGLGAMLAGSIFGGQQIAQHVLSRSPSRPSFSHLQEPAHNLYKRQSLGDEPTSGGDGSIVTTSDGSTFVYNNTFGGFWVSEPYNNSAQCRSSSPPLSQQWDFSNDLINGVSLGGWFLVEPFITPDYFEVYDNTVVDEWTLCQALGDNLTNFMTNHYETFITEIDFARIAGAGLNWIRLPLPYWFIEGYEDEPFLAEVGWKYFVRALDWARKYGLRVEVDFHAHPGSQNGLNHSGKLGTVGWMNGVMGLANAQRSLSYIRSVAEFLSQPEYTAVAPIFLPVNEPYQSTIGTPEMESFYLEMYKTVREASGIGAGNGPMISIHDGFLGASNWAGFMTGSDRIALEIHSYLAFSSFSSDSYQSLVTRPCQWWASQYNTSFNNFGFTFSGEWCLATNDCGQYLNNVGEGAKYDGTFDPNEPGQVYGSCQTYTDYPSFTPGFKQQLNEMANAYMDSSRNWFFWTWKINANSTGLVPSPLWSYSLGLEQGWMPTDPTTSSGACRSLAAELNLPGATYVDWTPPLESWMTGGAGANDIPASATAGFANFPPSSLNGGLMANNIPTMTPTAPAITLSVVMPTASPNGMASGSASGAQDGSNYSGSVPDGWNNPNDAGMGQYTRVAGCSYLNAFSGVGQAVPGNWPCSGSNNGLAARATAATPNYSYQPEMTAAP